MNNQSFKAYKNIDEDHQSTDKLKLTAIEQEFVHSMSFDYYGNRMVTCGADQKLKIWSKLEPDIEDIDQMSMFSPSNA